MDQSELYTAVYALRKVTTLTEDLQKKEGEKQVKPGWIHSDYCKCVD